MNAVQDLSTRDTGRCLRKAHAVSLVVGVFSALVLWPLVARPQTVPYVVVDTAQDKCYDDTSVISCPSAGQPFYGQDAEVGGSQPRYTVSADNLTVYDNNTGLTWQMSPDTNGDGVLSSGDKLTWGDAQARPTVLNAETFGGYGDWRVPTIKELYSLIDFRGTDPRGQGTDISGLIPFINTRYFDFVYGDPSAGERTIDAQYWSATPYVATTMGGNVTVFGVNFADGRIKGYPRDTGPTGSPMKEFLRCVRGNPEYGANHFVDNGDGTITDQATGLMWAKSDSGTAMNWRDALAWAQTQDSGNYLGHNDWRLPNAKELQSILDYANAPAYNGRPAVDTTYFSCTAITAEDCTPDYPWYWASTTHASSDGSGLAAVYICFGRAWGFMNGTWMDVHGAGAQRSDPKGGSLGSYPQEACGYYNGIAPQGDAIRIENYVRLVRDAHGSGNPLSAAFTFSPGTPTDEAPVTFIASASGGVPPYTYAWSFDGTAAWGQSATETLSAGNHTVTLSITDSVGAEASSTQVLTVVHAVAIAEVTRAANPFRLKIVGSGFEPMCTVAVNGTTAPVTLYKSSSLAVAKGEGLKAMVPRGVTVQITIVNPDGSTSAPFSYTR